MATPDTRPPKPRPIVNAWAQPFWEGTRAGKLLIQRCRECDQPCFYPRIACPNCGAASLDWIETRGRGTVYSYTVVQNNAPSAFTVDVPYVVAVIRLEEGVQMLSNIVDCEPSAVECDMAVEVTFRRLDDEFTLPKFRPVRP